MNNPASFAVPPDRLIHPAWVRFGETPSAVCELEQVLLVLAPGGTGRKRFARSWLDAVGGGQLWISPRDLSEQKTMIEDIQREVRADSSLRIIVAASPSPVWDQFQDSRGIPTATLDDLLLTASEVEDYARGRGPGLNTSNIYAETGGWLLAIDRLLANPEAPFMASRALEPRLRPWLNWIDPEWRLATALLVPDSPEELVEDLYGEAAPSNEELASAGLMVRSSSGTWKVPMLVRAAARRVMSQFAPVLVRASDERVLRMMASRGQVTEAVEYGVSIGAWSALSNLLGSGYWAVLFTQDPAVLGRVLSSFPASLQQEWILFNHVQALLGTGEQEGLYVSAVPSYVPYERDPLAGMLRLDADTNARKRNSLAITAGLLEVAILRVRGHHLEAADAAMRLRAVTVRGTEGDYSSTTLRALAELQCGIALHIADREHEAADAYHAAIGWGEESQNHFVLANATANLSLLLAMHGDSTGARVLLEKHFEHLRQVSWGVSMLERTAALARGCLNVFDLDQRALQDLLDTLPNEPDADEFWAVHVLLLAENHFFSGAQLAAQALLARMRSTRGRSAQSPLALKCLALSETHSRLAGGEHVDVPLPQGQTGFWGRLLVAWSRVISGDETASRLFAAELAGDAKAGPRVRHSARNLVLLLDSEEQLPESSLDQVSANYGADGELHDLLFLWQYPEVREQLISKLSLSAEKVNRLDSLPYQQVSRGRTRPRLTAREREILRGLQLGHSRAEIARSANLSINTVKVQLTSLYLKLNVSSKAQALKTVKQQGLI